MKIRDMETYLVGHPWKTWLFVRVLTDDGLHGIGEGSLGQLNRAVEGALRDLKPLIIGRSPFDIEDMVSRLCREVYADGAQIKMSAISAVEIACWDLIGKYLGQPIYNLLGGRCHDRLRAYANGWYRCERTPEAFAARARAVVGRGYTALKFDPFGIGWRSLTPWEEDLSVDIVRAVRDAVGLRVDVMIEAHSRFGVSSAIRIAHRLAEFKPAWLEEPVPHQNIQATIEVAKAVSIPIATGESLSSKHAVAELLRHGVIQIVQIEPFYLGGILASRKVADMVDAHYGVIAPHAAAGPIGTAVCAQIDAGAPNFYIQEFFHDFNVDWEKDLVTHPLECKDGYIEISDRPGLGMDLNLEEVRKHPYNETLDMNLFQEDWHLRKQETAE
ncbi:MAG TPA: mandelate racemase/muconate lactonizing enzyme family protein [Bryobacteraceae bacterium]|nr:mandelate racemase/muconate lactonizing enzyme family protein [Bryobacteraceae bacterium]